jgi:hypothetical protein
VDEEFDQFALRQLEEADTLLFGRATYQMMAGYWPTPAASQDDPAVTAKMNGLDKIVISLPRRKPFDGDAAARSLLKAMRSP